MRVKKNRVMSKDILISLTAVFAVLLMVFTPVATAAGQTIEDEVEEDDDIEPQVGSIDHPWPHGRRNIQTQQSDVDASYTDGHVLWEFGANDEIRTSPVVAGDGEDELVIFGSEDGYLYAVDPHTGQEEWSYIPDKGEMTGELALGHGNELYALNPDEDTLYKFCLDDIDTRNPEPVWTYEFSHSIRTTDNSGITVGAELIYVTAGFEDRDGNRRRGIKSFGDGGDYGYTMYSWSGAEDGWSHNLDQPVVHPAHEHDGAQDRVIFADRNEKRVESYKSSSESYSHDWTFSNIDGDFTTSLTFVPDSDGSEDGRTYFGDDHGLLYGVDSEGSYFKSSFPEMRHDEHFVGSFAYYDNTLYAYSSENKLYAINTLGSHEIKWELDVGYMPGTTSYNYQGPVVDSNGILYLTESVRSVGGRDFIAVEDDGEDPNILWEVDGSSTSRKASPAMGSTGAIYVPAVERMVAIYGQPDNLQIKSPEPDSWHEGSVTIEYEHVPETRIERYEVQHDDWNYWESKGMETIHTFTDLESGEHTFNVKAVDDMGAEGTTSITVNIDNEGRNPEITYPEENQWYNMDSIDVEWEDDPSGHTAPIEEYQIRLGSWPEGEWRSAGTTTTYTITTLETNEDEEVIVKAIDEAGNEVTDSQPFKVDLVDPSIDIYSPEEGEWIGDDEVTIEWSVDMGGSSSDLDYFEIQHPESGVWHETSTAQHTFEGLSDGEHTVEVRGYDEAGNVGSDEISFYISTEDIDIAITEPEEGEWFNEPSTTVYWTINSQGEAEMDEFIIYMNGEQVATTSSMSADIELPEGTDQTIKVEAVDEAGNRGSDEIDIDVDLTTPDIEITHPEEEEWLPDEEVTVEWTVHESGPSDMSEYTVYHNEEFLGFTEEEEFTLTHLDDGSHYVEIIGEDKAGNIGETEVLFYINVGGPEIEIHDPEEDEFFDTTTITSKWSSWVDGPASVDYHRIYLDGSLVERIGPNNAYTLTSEDGLTDGIHNLEVVAVDQTGLEASDSVNFNIDTIEPEVNIYEPESYEWYNPPEIYADWSGTNEGLAEIIEYDVILNGEKLHSTESTSTTISIEEQGPHDMTIVAHDEAGNEGSNTVTFNYDTISPSIDVTSPDDEEYVNEEDVIVDWYSWDDGDSGISSHEVYHDGELIAELGSQWYYELEDLDRGEHNVEVVVTDRAGNEASDDVTFYVDVEAPLFEIVSPDEGEWYTQSSIDVEWDLITSGESEIEEYRVYLNGMLREVIEEEGVEELTIEVNDDGENQVLIEAHDAAGNVGEEYVNFFLDTEGPEIELHMPENNAWYTDSEITVDWSLRSIGTSGLDEYIIYVDEEEELRTDDDRKTIELDDGEDITIEVEAKDVAGNTDIESKTIHVDTTIPDVDIFRPSDSQWTRNTDPLVEWSYSTGTSGLDYHEIRINETEWINTGEMNEYDLEDMEDGKHLIEVRTSDVAGNTGYDEIEVYIDTTSPHTFFEVDDDVKTTEDTFYFDGSDSYDPVSEIDEIEWKFKSGSSYQSSEDLYAEHSYDEVGEYIVTLKLTDQAGNTNTTSLTVRVDDGPPVAILEPEDDAVTTLEYVTFYADDSFDEEGDIVEYNWYIFGEYHPDKDGPIVEFQMTDSEGLVDVGVEVVNEAGLTDYEEVTILVDNTDPIAKLEVNPEYTQTGENVVLDASESEDDIGFGSGMPEQSGLDRFEWDLNNDGEFEEKGETITHAFLSEGEHIVTVKVINNAGLTSTEEVIVTVDDTPPSFEITEPIDGAYLNETEIYLNWTEGDSLSPVAYYEYNLGSGWISTESDTSTTTSTLSEGLHSLEVRAVDAAGNKGSETIDFTVDTEVPVVSITNPYDGEWFTSEDVVVEWSADDFGVSGMSHHEIYHPVHEKWIVVEEELYYELKDLSDGVHEVQVRSYDNAGNHDEDVISFGVDKEKPNVDIVNPEDGVWQTESEIKVEWEVLSTGVSGFNESSILVNGESRGDTTENYYYVEVEDDEDITLTLETQDVAGNVGTETITINVDSQTPLTNITSPEDDYWTNNDYITIEWIREEVGVSGLDRHEIYDVNSGEWKDVGTSTDVSFIELDDGEHTTMVRTYDEAGNMGETEVTFNVDTQDPVIEITAPEEDAWKNTTTILVEWELLEIGFGEIDEYHIYLNDELEMTTEEREEYIEVEDGTDQVVEVVAYDLAGNFGKCSTTFNIETSDIDINITTPEEEMWVNDSSVLVEWDLVEVGEGEIDEYVVYLNGDAVGSTTNTHMTVSVEDGEEQTFRVKGYDISGNVGDDIVTFGVDTVNPHVGILQPDDGEMFDKNNITVAWDSSNDGPSDLDYHEVYLDGEFKTELGSQSYYDFVDLDDGKYEAEIFVFDQAGNYHSTIVEFHVDTTPPEIEIATPEEDEWQTSREIEVEWDVIDAGHLGVEEFDIYLNGRHQATTTENSVIITVREDDFDHQISVEAHDYVGHTSVERVNFNLDSVEPKIDVISPEEDEWKTSYQIVAEWSVDEIGISGLKYHELYLNDDLLGTTENEEFLIELEEDEEHVLTIYTHDEAGNVGEVSITFYVDATTPDVSILSPEDGEWLNKQDVLLNWTLEETGFSGLDYFAVSKHGDEWIDVGTNQSYLFEDLIDGEYELHVKVVDNAGNSAFDSVEVIIDTEDPDISITTPEDGECFDDQFVYTFEWELHFKGGSEFDRYEIYFGESEDDLELLSVIEDKEDTEYNKALDTGSYILVVEVYNSAGNNDSDLVWFAVDDTIPDFEITNPENNSWATDSLVNISWDVSEIGPSGLDYYELSIDGEVYTTKETSFTIELNDAENIDVSVTAYDNAGNSATEFVSFGVDSVDPVIEITSPENETWFTDTNVEVEWELQEVGISDLSHYEERINEGEWTNIGEKTYEVYKDLAEQGYTVEIRAHDTAGNTVVEDIQFGVDKTVPDFTIINPESYEWYTESDIELELDWTEDDFGPSGLDEYVLYHNDDEYGVYQEKSITISLEDGAEQVLTVELFDKAGNDGSENVTISIDTTVPDSEFINPSDSSWVTENDIEVIWETSDSGPSGLKSYELVYDDEVLYYGTSISTTITLDDGTNYTLTLITKDNAGNVDVRDVTFDVDATDPVVNITSPENGEVFENQDVMIEWYLVEPGISGLKEYEIRENPDEEWIPVGENTSKTLEDLDTDSYTVQIRATDVAGNEYLAEVTFAVDVDIPVIEITYPEDGSEVDENYVNITWEVVEGAPSGVDYYEIDINDGNYTETTEKNYMKYLFSEGYHSVEIAVTDNVGYSNSTIHHFEVTSSGFNSLSLSVMNAVMENDDDESYWQSSDTYNATWEYDLSPDMIDYFEVRLNDSDGPGEWIVVDYMYAGDDDDTTKSHYVFEGLTEDEYSVDLKMVPAVPGDNDTEEGHDSFGIDHTPPDVYILDPEHEDVFGNESIEVKWDGSCDNSGVSHFEIKHPDTGEWIDVGDNTSYVFDGLDSGEHAIEVKAYDNVGNEETTSVIIYVDNVLPEINPIYPENNDTINDSDLIVNWTVDETTVFGGIDYYEIRIDKGWSFEKTEDSYYEYSNLRDGTYHVIIRGVDEAGNENQTEFTFTIDTETPEVDIISPSDEWQTGDDFTIEWEVDEGDSELEKYKIYIEGELEKVIKNIDNTSYKEDLLWEGEDVDLSVHAYDVAGNVGQDHIQFKADNTVPVLEILEPKESDAFDETNVEIEWDSYYHGPSGLDYYEIYHPEDEEWISRSTLSYYTIEDLDEGSHTVYVRAYDEAGNQRRKNVTFSVILTDPSVDITHPVQYDESGANPYEYVFNTTNILVELDIEGEGVEYTEITVGDTTWKIEGDMTVIDLEEATDTPNGKYLLKVETINQVGGSGVDSVEFFVDLDGPWWGNNSINYPEAGQYNNEELRSFDWNNALDHSENEAIDRYLLEISDCSDFSNIIRSHSSGEATFYPEVDFSSGDLGEGHYYWRIRVVDIFERESITEYRQITYDTTPPHSAELGIDEDIERQRENYVDGGEVHMELGVHDDLTELEEMEFVLATDSDFDNILKEGTFEENISYEFEEDGWYSLYIKYIDRAGQSAVADNEVYVNLEGPEIITEETGILEGYHWLEGDSNTTYLESVVEDDVLSGSHWDIELQIDIYENFSSEFNQTHVFSESDFRHGLGDDDLPFQIPTDEEGMIPIYIRAIDEFGRTSQTIEKEVCYDNTPPVGEVEFIGGDRTISPSVNYTLEAWDEYQEVTDFRVRFPEYDDEWSEWMDYTTEPVTYYFDDLEDGELYAQTIEVEFKTEYGQRSEEVEVDDIIVDLKSPVGELSLNSEYTDDYGREFVINEFFDAEVEISSIPYGEEFEYKIMAGLYDEELVEIHGWTDGETLRLDESVVLEDLTLPEVTTGEFVIELHVREVFDEDEEKYQYDEDNAVSDLLYLDLEQPTISEFALIGEDDNNTKNANWTEYADTPLSIDSAHLVEGIPSVEITEMRIGINEEPDDDSEWIEYDEEYLVTLPDEEGYHTIYIQTRAAHGRKSSVVGQTIFLTHTPIEGDILIEDGTKDYDGGTTVSVDMLVEEEAQDHITEMRYAESLEALKETDWGDYDEEIFYSFEDETGKYNLYVQYKTHYERKSEVHHEDIILVRDEIRGSVTLEDDDVDYTNDENVMMYFNAEGENRDIMGINITQISPDGEQKNVIVDFESNIDFEVNYSGAGLYSFEVEFIDQYNLSSDTFTDEIYIDTGAPNIDLENEEEKLILDKANLNETLEWTIDDDSGLAHQSLIINGEEVEVWDEYDPELVNGEWNVDDFFEFEYFLEMTDNTTYDIVIEVEDPLGNYNSVEMTYEVEIYYQPSVNLEFNPHDLDEGNQPLIIDIEPVRDEYEYDHIEWYINGEKVGDGENIMHEFSEGSYDLEIVINETSMNGDVEPLVISETLTVTGESFFDGLVRWGLILLIIVIIGAAGYLVWSRKQIISETQVVASDDVDSKDERLEVLKEAYKELGDTTQSQVKRWLQDKKDKKLSKPLISALSGVLRKQGVVEKKFADGQARYVWVGDSSNEQVKEDVPKLKRKTDEPEDDDETDRGEEDIEEGESEDETNDSTTVDENSDKKKHDEEKLENGKDSEDDDDLSEKPKANTEEEKSHENEDAENQKVSRVEEDKKKQEESLKSKVKKGVRSLSQTKSTNDVEEKNKSDVPTLSKKGDSSEESKKKDSDDEQEENTPTTNLSKEKLQELKEKGKLRTLSKKENE